MSIPCIDTKLVMNHPVGIDIRLPHTTISYRFPYEQQPDEIMANTFFAIDKTVLILNVFRDNRETIIFPCSFPAAGPVSDGKTMRCVCVCVCGPSRNARGSKTSERVKSEKTEN